MSRPTVAIVGASADRSKFGNKSLRAHLQAGYEVFPVNPRGAAIEGLECFGSIDDLPNGIDRYSMYVAPSVGIEMLPVIAKKACGELWLNPGSTDDNMTLAAKSLGLRVIEGCSIVALGFHPSDFKD